MENTAAQEQALPQTTVNTSDTTLNPNSGSRHGAGANWDQPSTVPQTRIPNNFPVGVIENTTAQKQAASQTTINTTHAGPNAEQGSAHGAGANWDQLPTLPQGGTPNDLPVGIIANTTARVPASQTTVNTADNLALEEAKRYMVTGKREC